MRELDHNAHSVFLLYYHLILVVYQCLQECQQQTPEERIPSDS